MELSNVAKDETFTISAEDLEAGRFEVRTERGSVPDLAAMLDLSFETAPAAPGA